MKSREVCELLGDCRAPIPPIPGIEHPESSLEWRSPGISHVPDTSDDTRFLDSASRERALQKILPELNKRTEQIIDPLKSLQLNGYLRLRSHVGCDAVENIKQHIFSEPLYRGHVKAYDDSGLTPLKVQDEEALSRLPAGYYTSDISHLLRCPDILRIASDPLVLHFVSSYLGFVPSVYSINMMWNVSQESLDSHGVQKFHRDWDDFKTCCLFVYMTDVEPSMGPHIYQVGSHLTCEEEEANEHCRLQKDPVDVIGDYHQETFLGSQGDAFITDPYGLHKGGSLERKGFRGVLWIRYGMYDNYVCRKLDKNTEDSHVDAGDDPYCRHLWRLFL